MTLYFNHPHSFSTETQAQVIATIRARPVAALDALGEALAMEDVFARQRTHRRATQPRHRRVERLDADGAHFGLVSELAAAAHDDAAWVRWWMYSLEELEDATPVLLPRLLSGCALHVVAQVHLHELVVLILRQLQWRNRRARTQAPTSWRRRTQDVAQSTAPRGSRRSGPARCQHRSQRGRRRRRVGAQAALALTSLARSGQERLHHRIDGAVNLKGGAGCGQAEAHGDELR